MHPCRSDYKKEHYAINRQRYIDNAAINRRRMLRHRAQLIVQFLREHPCMDCGESDVVVLEFDHLENKAFSVSHGIREKNWETVLREIEKCDVVCANCHRRRTARKGNFARYAAANKTSGRRESDPRH